jgi:hypothetical protein
MGGMVYLALRRLRFSPLGESLSFASPKESNPRKGDPTSLPCGYPIWRARAGAPPTRPGTGHKTPRAAELGHGSAFSPPAHTKSAALKGSNPKCRLHVMPSHRQALAHARMPLLCRREAQPDGEERCGVSEPGRASSRTAPAGEHRREAEGRHIRGRFFFGYFLLAKQKKVTRPQAKSEAVVHVRYSQRTPT